MNPYIYQGHIVHKHLGQNFLNDQSVIDNIVAAINPKKDQAVVEIGPGLLALTESIGKYLDHLTVIEIDYDLVMRLQNHPFLSSKITIYHQDAMNVNFKKLSKKIGRSLHIVGNLPYNISTALLFHLFKYINNISEMHFMIQKEVANRLLAKPNSKAYNKLSVITQYHCQVNSILEVPSGAFRPSPKVDSVVVRLVPHAVVHPVKNLRMLNTIATTAFNQRRKMIHNSLCSLLTANELIVIGIDPLVRAENISVEQYCQITNYIDEKIRIKKRKMSL